MTQQHTTCDPSHDTTTTCDPSHDTTTPHANQSHDTTTHHMRICHMTQTTTCDQVTYNNSTTHTFILLFSHFTFMQTIPSSFLILTTFNKRDIHHIIIEESLTL